MFSVSTFDGQGKSVRFVRRFLALIAVFVMCGWGLAQAQEGNAGGFEIDDCGTLFSGDGPNDTPVCTPKSDVSCSAISAGDDWAQGPANHGIFDNDGMANIDPGTGDPYRAFLQTDQNWGNQGDGSDASQFGSTSDKNNNYIGVGQLPWSWNGTGGGPQKNDVTNSYVYTYFDPGTGHRWVAVGAETRSNNGDSHVDVEFNFAGLTVTEDPPGSGAGFIYGNGPAGGRTLDEDFVISIDFQQGGGLPIGTVRIWTETAPGVYEYVLAQDLGIPTAGVIYSATNICNAVHNTGGDWTHFASNGAPSSTLLSFQLTEMAADLTALGIDVDPCNPSSTVMFKTRSSQSFTAELKDWNLFTFPFEPTPECAISGPTLVCPGEEDIEYNVEETTGLNDVTFEWTITGDATFCDGTTTATGETVCVDADMVCDGQFMLIVTVAKGPCVSTCLYLVDVDDDVPPEITCPDDITVQCAEDVPACDPDDATASDNCGPVTVTCEGDVSDGNTCPETITRTFRATDFCGNTAECTQLIIVDDTIPPEISCPADLSVQCIEDVPPAAEVNATDNCDGVLVASLEQTTLGTCPTVITRTWTATDTCGNLASCSQTITVYDTTAPVVTCDAWDDTPTTAGCCEVTISFSATVTDNCEAPVSITCEASADNASVTMSSSCNTVVNEDGSVTVSGSFKVGDVTGCPVSGTILITATDECGNIGQCTDTVTYGLRECP